MNYSFNIHALRVSFQGIFFSIYALRVFSCSCDSMENILKLAEIEFDLLAPPQSDDETQRESRKVSCRKPPARRRNFFRRKAKADPNSEVIFMHVAPMKRVPAEGWWRTPNTDTNRRISDHMLQSILEKKTTQPNASKFSLFWRRRQISFHTPINLFRKFRYIPFWVLFRMLTPRDR